jgi:integrase
VNKNPLRPRATYDRYKKIRAKADQVDPLRLFGPFLDLVEALGWRVTSICELRANDVDLAKSKARPHGGIHKRGEVDEEGVDMWVPLSKSARTAIDRVRAICRCVGEAPLFHPLARLMAR